LLIAAEKVVDDMLLKSTVTIERQDIDTCYRTHGFPPQFKFKNKKEAECNNNQQNHEGLRSEVNSQQISFTTK